MAAPIDICNLALSNLGDDASVSSIDPPDQSRQAVLCAQFYPIARDALLEAYPWGFAAKRVTLAQLNSTVPANPQWQYMYSLPEDFLAATAVQDVNAPSDYSTPDVPTTLAYGTTQSLASLTPFGYTGQEFVVETSPTDGTGVIYTNQANAMLRYTARVTNSEVYSAMFVEALSWFLAAKLAGPIIKGTEGRAAALEARKMAEYFFKQAAAADANDRRIHPQQQVSWIAAR